MTLKISAGQQLPHQQGCWEAMLSPAMRVVFFFMLLTMLWEARLAEGVQSAHEGIADGEPERESRPPVETEVVVEEVVPPRSKDVAPPKRRLAGLAGSYDRLLHDHFLPMSFLNAGLIGTMGDMVAQLVEHQAGRAPLRRVRGYGHRGFQPDWRRTLDVGVLTLAIDGLVTPRWHLMLERMSELRSVPVVLLKTLLGSLVYGPLANGLFLAGVPLLRYGRRKLTGGFDWLAWRRQLLVATVRDLQMWPPFNVFSFALLPMHWRPLSANLLGLGFVCVLSCTSLSDDFLPLGKDTVTLIEGWLDMAAGVVQQLVRQGLQRTLRRKGLPEEAAPAVALAEPAQ